MPATRHPLAFVTGTSSGIGAALVHDLLERGWRVVGAARRLAPITHPHYTHFQLDLADLAALRIVLDTELAPLLADPAVSRVGLVNNAAKEGLLGPITRLDATALADIYAVNVTAPILLMGWFQRHAPPGRPLRIVNVSTGAAVMPIPGLGAYGSSKAALRMAGMILGAELDADTAPPERTILSYEPGLVDTPMQTAVRTSSVEIVPSVQMFKEFQSSGALVAPARPAREIAEYLESDGHARWEERRLPG